MLCFRPYKHLQQNKHDKNFIMVSGSLRILSAKKEIAFMNDKYISLLLEYSMYFTLCGYQMDIKFDVIQTFQELHPALAAAEYIYSIQPCVHCPCN